MLTLGLFLELNIMERADHITQLLRSWNQGDQGAMEELMPLVFDELHKVAARYMAAERPGHTLQTTALVNETYLRLVSSEGANWEGRTHFYGVCAKMMRRILVDWMRTRQALKRGGEARALDLDSEALSVVDQPGTDLVALDDALEALSAIDARKGRVVELRFFGGLSVKETAEILEISPETVQRDWKMAKSWLRRELSGGSARGV
jgi:RNA polymerase sigma factor (TIGR02999 family)